MLPLYDTVAEPLGRASWRRSRASRYVTFTSSSTVRFFLDAGGDGAREPRASSRSDRSRARPPREHGLRVDVEAERHDIDGLVAALVRDAAERTPA